MRTDVFVIDNVELATAGRTSVFALDNTLLQAPEGSRYVLAGDLPWPSNELSVWEDADPAVVANDVGQYDEETTPGGFGVTVNPDGTVELGEGDDGSEQTFDYRLWRQSDRQWTQYATVTLEEVAQDAQAVIQPGIASASGVTLGQSAGALVALAAGSASGVGTELSPQAGSAISAEVAIQPGSALGVGTTLVPDVAQVISATAEVQPGTAQGAGQQLAPQTGASIPVSVELQPGAAVASGRTLAPSIGIGQALVSGRATAAGRLLGNTIGHSITFQPGSALARGRQLQIFTGFTLGRIRDPQTRSATVKLDTIRG